MPETYFVKPQTADRIRACWIGAGIERYADWLPEQGYSTWTVLRRVPVLAAFGEFARRRGASVPAGLPIHVDGFVAARVAARRGARRPGVTAREVAAEVRGPVEQMLTVIRVGERAMTAAAAARPASAGGLAAGHPSAPRPGWRPARGYASGKDDYLSRLRKRGRSAGCSAWSTRTPGALTCWSRSPRRPGRCRKWRSACWATASAAAS